MSVRKVSTVQQSRNCLVFGQREKDSPPPPPKRPLCSSLCVFHFFLTFFFFWSVLWSECGGWGNVAATLATILTNASHIHRNFLHPKPKSEAATTAVCSWAPSLLLLCVFLYNFCVCVCVVCVGVLCWGCARFVSACARACACVCARV